MRSIRGIYRSKSRLIALTAMTALIAVAFAPSAVPAGPPQLGVGQGSTDNTVYYVNWITANPGTGTAAGVISLPDGSTVNVTFAAVFANGSPGSMAFAQTSCGTNYWNPSAPYISAEVPNPPPACDILALQGGQNQIYRLTLSEAIRDPLMAIVSPGQPGVPTTYDFDSPFTIVSQGTGYWGGTSTSLKQLPGDVLEGREGHGAIRFLGTFSTFSWTVPTPEYWHGFTFGIRTTEELAQPVTVDEGQLATNSGTWSGEGVSLSASVGNVTKNADGTWTWSLLTSDGPSQSQNVTITATNAYGTFSRNFDLAVNNLPPTATLTNNGPGFVDEPLLVSFSNQDDPSSGDTGTGFRYAFACDGGSLGAATYATSVVDPFTECTYSAEGEVTVRARIIDKDGGFTEYTTTTTIQPAVAVEQCTDLIAGQHEVVGEVCVINDDETLTVTYRTTGGWSLRETHAHVADDVSGIPTSGGGNPVPGRFQLSSRHDVPILEFSHSTPLADIGTSDGQLVLAAHAAVASLVSSESAWGQGARFSTKNWAMYFDYSIQ